MSRRDEESKVRTVGRASEEARPTVAGRSARGYRVRMSVRTYILLLSGLLLGCGDCVRSQQLDALDWVGELPDGTPVGCACECVNVATCYATDLTCPTGAESNLAGHVLVLTPDDEVLGAHARAELTAVCEAEGAVCEDSGG